MHQAADLEVATPKHAVTPGPTLPASELLGDLLIEQKQPAEALVAYERSLKLYPRRFNSLLGAARAAHANGDQTRAAQIYSTELMGVADKETPRPALKEVQSYLAADRKD